MAPQPSCPVVPAGHRQVSVGLRRGGRKGNGAATHIRAVLNAGHGQASADVGLEGVGSEDWKGRGLAWALMAMQKNETDAGKCFIRLARPSSSSLCRAGLALMQADWKVFSCPPPSSSPSSPLCRAGLALMQADGNVFSCHRDRWDAIWCARNPGTTTPRGGQACYYIMHLSLSAQMGRSLSDMQAPLMGNNCAIPPLPAHYRPLVALLPLAPCSSLSPPRRPPTLSFIRDGELGSSAALLSSGANLDSLMIR